MSADRPTVREILDRQRRERPTEMEIAWQDFLELTPDEQREFVFMGLMYTVRDAGWLAEMMNTIMKGRPK